MFLNGWIRGFKVAHSRRSNALPPCAGQVESLESRQMLAGPQDAVEPCEAPAFPPDVVIGTPDVVPPSLPALPAEVSATVTAVKCDISVEDTETPETTTDDEITPDDESDSDQDSLDDDETDTDPLPYSNMIILPTVDDCDDTKATDNVFSQKFDVFDGFRGGVQVAAGDVNGDGFEEVIAGTSRPYQPSPWSVWEWHFLDSAPAPQAANPQDDQGEKDSDGDWVPVDPAGDSPSDDKTPRGCRGENCGPPPSPEWDSGEIDDDR